MVHLLDAIPFLVAAVLFIVSLRGLASQETARRGNFYGILGMTMAVAITLYPLDDIALRYFGGAVAVGCIIGFIMAVRVAMTAMPELVAMLHSFVGAAAILVGFGGFFHDTSTGIARTIHLCETYAAVWIGALTFTGSIIAFGKLKGSISGKPLLLPARHLINLFLFLASVGMLIGFLMADRAAAEAGAGQMEFLTTFMLCVATGLAMVMGILMVMAIGGADMPVVVSLLNSYSGWTAAAAGFMLGKDVLIVTGALVGSSGAILSYIMCRAMNRSIWNVVFGGFGTADTKTSKSDDDDAEVREVIETSVEETAAALLAAKRVIVIPGYGMAVAHAQHAVNEMTEALRSRDIDVQFAIHPVAGRLPGHMNVLLAEARVPYDIVMEMDEINDDFPQTDVAMVIGANDIVNPSAQTDPASPIAGMPVLETWKAARTVMLKRGRAAGYAGVDNPLFYHENTRMLFGDAHDTMTSLVSQLKKDSSDG
jgi:NAD(P) transhydrogenase subunit beta